MTKRITALLFCLLFVLSSVLFAACGKDAEETGEKFEADTTGFLDKVEWGGKEINILCRQGSETSYITYQVDAEETSDDPVIASLYRRNAFIKQEYQLDINVVSPESGEDLIEKFRTDIMSNNGAYQAVVHPIFYLAPLASDGLLGNFNGVDNDYIRLDKDYWDQAIVEDVVINDNVFFLNGDAIIQDDESTWVMFFNKDLIEEYGLDNPYDLVYDNEWTIDKMYEMLQNVELTHGAQKSYDPAVGDKWGMVVQSYDFYQFMMAADQRMVDNSGDKPVLRVLDGENTKTFQQIANWFINDGLNIGVADFHGKWDSGVYGQEIQIFTNGNALFMPNALTTVGGQSFRQAEISFGLLPLPKRSDLQEDYAAGVNTYSCDVIAIPHNLEGELLDATCYALEAMAFFGKQLVTPEYYDRTLSLKRLKDDDSVKMLDLIFANRIYDMGSVINFNGGIAEQGTLYFYTNLLSDRSTDITGKYKEFENSFQAGIDTLVEQCYSE